MYDQLPILTMGLFSYSLVVFFISFRFKKPIKYIGFLAILPMLIQTMQMHQVSLLLERLSLILAILTAYVVSKKFYEKLSNLENVLKYSLSIGLNFVLASIIVGILLAQYLMQMRIYDMTFLFGAVISGFGSMLHGHLFIYGIMFILFALVLYILKKWNINAKILSILLVITLAGTLYSSTLSFVKTMYFYRGVVNQTAMPTNPQDDPGQHNGMMYATRILYKDTMPLTQDQIVYHYTLAHTLLAFGVIGTIVYLNNLVFVFKIYDSRNSTRRKYHYRSSSRVRTTRRSTKR